MPIDKIDTRYIMYDRDDNISENQARQIINTMEKLNELIDFINTREQDRSAQIERCIIRMNKLENDQESMHRVHDVHMDNTVDTMTDHRIRIEKLEKNPTQPKEEESDCVVRPGVEGVKGNFRFIKEESILPCPWCRTIPELSILVCLPAIYQIKCEFYGCQNKSGFHGSTQQEAIRAWNHRHDK